MKIPCYAAALLAVLVLTAAVIAGCSRTRTKEQPAAGSQAAGDSRLAGTLRDIGGAPADLSVAGPLRPFFAAGLGFIVLGGLAACLGGLGSGLLLLGLGAATTATAVLFVQYPWAVLVLALAAAAAAALALHDRRKALRELGLNRDALEATAEVIQKIPEGQAIKAGLVGLGSEIEAKVRQAVGPIKDKLRREGKIG